MTLSRRELLMSGMAAAATLASGRRVETAPRTPRRPTVDGKRLGTIFNNDINNILWATSGDATTAAEYQRAVYAILDLKPGVLAQNVGLPDAVIYPSDVASPFDAHLEEVTAIVWPGGKAEADNSRREAGAMRRLRELGTDPLTLTIAACRKRGIPILASYRMNAEDFYHGTTLLSDFERAHPEWKIPGANCLDPAVAQVYEHRMSIFREVAERCDIDGIEFDFRRWYHMVSDPLKNHPVLTRMVRETRQMLGDVARRKRRKKLLLGARVGPSLDSEPSPFLFPGIYYPEKPTNASCKELGLDVKTWVAEGLVDYLCPTLFCPSLPGLPLTREFVALAKGTAVGIYPTLFSPASWMHGVCERTVSLSDKDQRPLALYKDDLCGAALRIYERGADGISTFNWYSHLRNARMPHLLSDAPAGDSSGSDAVQTCIYPLLRDPAAIRRYREQPWAVRGR